ncbi:hypothetical protein COU76_05765 [Candidatus Peregrinibacteria bacterium CG10_big_fil_rev_8_21_14_0_10_49_10]|nr:MAG: hypothetical protein COU76_05765 [Candidatus Peregrinibacteria bacterium CG10_big_fil_rev_8_21_14_0_10_49_10]
MKRLFRPVAALFLSLCIITPGLAYFAVPGNTESGPVTRVSKRTLGHQTKKENKLPDFIPIEARTRSAAEMNESDGRNMLSRAEGRQLRRYNRTVKPGSDRYRVIDVLNTRTNRRSLRRMGNQSALALPRTLVQTGSYDRPTRRDIITNFEHQN